MAEGEEVEADALAEIMSEEKNQEAKPKPDEKQQEDSPIGLSITSYPLYEEKRCINSPRSLEACRIEGILPEQLLFKPEASFQIKGKPDYVTKMWFEKYEQKRREMIDIVKKRLETMIYEMERKSSGSLPKTSYMTKNQSVPELRGQSRMSSEKSQFLMEVVSDSNRENYEQIVQKAKEREMKLMNKMLKNEEMKNSKYEEQQAMKEYLEDKERQKEKLRNIEMKKRAEEKIKKEKQKVEIMRKEELRQREEAQERMRKENERKELEMIKDQEKKKLREKEVQKKEELRKEKAAKAAYQREQELIKQEQKLEIMKNKLREKEKLIKLQREEQRRQALIRRQQFEQVKDQVQMKIEIEENRKLEEFIISKRRKDEQEQKLRHKKFQQIEEIKKRAEERNLKIQQAIMESYKLEDEKKQKILVKQKVSSQRIEHQRMKQLEEEEKRKEMFLIKNEIKKINAERKRRKDQYKIEKIKEELEFDDVKRNAFSQQKDEFKSLRVKNQVQAQQQREFIRTALHHMAVWNVWDMDIVKNIIADPAHADFATIEEIVRHKSSQASSQRRHMSTLGRSNYGSLIDNSHYTARRYSRKTSFDHQEPNSGTTYYVSREQSDSKKRSESQPPIESTEPPAKDSGSIPEEGGRQPEDEYPEDT